MRMGSKRAVEQDKSESVWVVAVIDEQILDERIVSASHEAIEAWNMMSMTMNFSVSDEVDFNVLTPGTKLHMEIKMGNSGMYEIIGTHIISAELIQSEENKSSAEGSSPIIVGLGIYSLKRTPVDAIPDLSDVQVIIKTSYAGQAPQVVQDQVTYPLTTAMLSVPAAVTVRGYSFFGDSYVYVIFDEDTDLYWARSRGSGRCRRNGQAIPSNR